MDIGASLDSASTAFQAALLWILARPFWLLLTLEILDILTGLLVALKEQRVSSKISREGMIRKVALLLTAAFGSLLEPVAQQLVGAPAFGQGIAWMLCAPECISVFENLRALGVPIPGLAPEDPK